MGDKQAYLAQAVPVLLTRLVQPNCLDANGNVVGSSDNQGHGTCATGSVEFPPVHDMHVGLVSTSLGTRLSDLYGGANAGQGTICPVTGTGSTLTTTAGVTFPNHDDDRAELLNRTNATDASGDPLASAGSLNYLSCFPSDSKNAGSTPPANAITSATTLISDVTSLIQGVGYYGCGIESQLESWYRFLVQPDPYDSMSLDANGNAQWVGVDTTILKQRQSFLRPDSLVAIFDLTDENDSEIDVRAVAGKGYWWMAQNFDPFKSTSACAEDAENDGLTDPSTCASCGSTGQTCSTPDDYSAPNDWGYNPNLRHVHMMQKYGVWPQFPIQRYALGLTSPKVPDRSGEYPTGATSYQGLTNLDCTNPLFAASLPDGSDTSQQTLCNLPAGTRTPDLIYYTHVGGVPYQLLQGTPGDGTCPAGTPPGDCPPKTNLSSSDWTKILGANPLNFDYSGIDPHMIESYEPRSGIPAAPAAADADGVSDWVTNSGAEHVLDVDREYACTFPLPTPRDCTDTTDPTVSYACDCPSTAGLTPQELPPTCNPNVQTQQVGAKAYPTQRELLLANLLGTQSTVASICPIHVAPASGETAISDPLYGYNPAMNGLVNRMKGSLLGQCLPQALTPSASGAVSCAVLVQLPNAGPPGTCANPGAACNTAAGLYGPGVVPPGASAPPLTQDVLESYCKSAEASYTGSGVDPSTLPVCALAQLSPGTNPGDFSNGSCTDSADPGWCYVTGAAAGTCPQTILFTSGEPPTGSTVAIQCSAQ
jgi:hypothetical protein